MTRTQFSRNRGRFSPPPQEDVVLVEFSMSPLTKGESVGEYVARSLEIIDRSGVDYRLNPMGTVIEAKWEEAFGLIRKCFDRMRRDCDRISTIIKVDYRKGAKGRLASKVASVERTLGKKLKT